MNIKELILFIRKVENIKEFYKSYQDKILEPYRKDLRRMLNRNVNTIWESTHCKDDTSYYIKEFFITPFTEQEKEEFINEQWQHTGYAFDCTGRPFTTSIRICNFKEPNSFGAMSVVYHFMAIDV